MADGTLFVTGLGRCGTTLVMRMLDRGGVPFAGSRPDYEPHALRPGRVDLSWVIAQGGKAVKWVDPTVATIRADVLKSLNPTFLIMTRDPEHQARSMHKMIGARPSKTGVAALATSIRRDVAIMRARLEPIGICYHATFEWALREPHQMAGKLAAIAQQALGRAFDMDAAAGAVIRRTPFCAPDFSIEERLIAENIHHA